LNKFLIFCYLITSDSGHGPVAVFSEHDNEP